jgi:hypothetical protein
LLFFSLKVNAVKLRATRRYKLALVPPYFVRKSQCREEGLVAKPLVTRQPEKAMTNSATQESPTKHQKVLFHFFKQKILNDGQTLWLELKSRHCLLNTKHLLAGTK